MKLLPASQVLSPVPMSSSDCIPIRYLWSFEGLENGMKQNGSAAPGALATRAAYSCVCANIFYN